MKPGRYSDGARSVRVGPAWAPIGLFFRILPFTDSDLYAIPYRPLIPAEPTAAVSAAALIGQPRIGRHMHQHSDPANRMRKAVAQGFHDLPSSSIT